MKSGVSRWSVYLPVARLSTYLEAIERDRCDADCRDEHVGAGDHRHQLAHEVSERPDGHGDLHQVEGLREEAERQVGHGQVDDEHVARGAHVPVASHHVADEPVAGGAEDDEDGEGDDEDRLRRRVEVVDGHHRLVVLREEALDLRARHERVVERRRGR